MFPEKPQKVGRYEIKSELGKGGMATVYKAFDPRFEREVALKLLPHEMMHDATFQARFEREAKTIARLEHPAIVPVYDVGDEDGQPYFVMRCMVGGSLADRIAKGPLSIKEAAKIMERISDALDEAHIKGVIHRDLKPGNILFDNTGEPYISDFGIAKLTQSQSATMTGGAVIGTPAYMSPEQAKGDPEKPIDGRSDVYALGVILYEMLSGEQPYQSTTPMGVVVKHITEPIPHILDKNRDLPPAVETVIEKAMAKNPDERFSTAGEFSIALSAVASGSTGEQAIKTASMSATVIKAKVAKTQLVAQKTQAVQKQAQQKSISPLVYVLPVVVVFGIVILAAGAYFLGFFPTFQAPAATVAPTIQPTPVPPTEIPPTEAPTFTPTLPPPTEAIVPTDTPMPTETPKPVIKAIGGADKVAFVANNEIYLMNLDGSGELVPLTNDGKAKTDLQWMPDGKSLVFLSDNNVNTVEGDTGRFDTITSFPYAEYFDAFRISPDGKMVAISLNRQMFILPFDLEALKQARVQSDLSKMVAAKGCLQYKGETQAAVQVKEFRWSADMKLISWLFPGVSAGGGPEDIIRIVDISSCDPNRLSKKDEFPGTRFTPSGFVSNPVIADFDWDGTYGFILNTALRYSGWGDLYFYNFDLRKGYSLNPIGGNCCYRDARFSPDGTHIFFAFQDYALGDKSTIQLYYIPFKTNYQGTNYQPLPIPTDLYKSKREAPQPALHAVQR